MRDTQMKLKSIRLNNFRSYAGEVEIRFEELTVLVGKNDAGKSTVLEAVGLLLGSSDVKADKGDCNVFNQSQEFSIAGTFIDYPDLIQLDNNQQISLAENYLLNQEGALEIKRTYNCATKTIQESTSLIAYHPSHEQVRDLLKLTITQLKKRAADLEVSLEEVEPQTETQIRQAIWHSLPNRTCKLTELPVKIRGIQAVWSKLQIDLPTFVLFRADRPNTDDESEIQDPMKLAIRKALLEASSQIEEIKETVRKYAEEVANKTLEQLQEISPTLASELVPRFRTEPRWDNIFKMSLESDGGIPLNKRGSGARRLVLLSFLRAAAENEWQDKSDRNMIYAIEEPETSQHPENQQLLVDTLMDLADTDKYQVILTTHLPRLIGQMRMADIRFIKSKRRSQQIYDGAKDTETLVKVARDLGVLPPILGVRLVIGVEGPNDVTWLLKMNALVRERFPKLPNLDEDGRILVIPLGGSTAKHWVEQDYLSKFSTPRAYILDGDKQENKDLLDGLNQCDDGSFGFTTERREAENYLDPKLIMAELGTEIEIGKETDVPKALFRKWREEQRVESHEQIQRNSARTKWRNDKQVKKALNRRVLPKMQLENLDEAAIEEFCKWFKEVEQLLEK